MLNSFITCYSISIKQTDIISVPVWYSGIALIFHGARQGSKPLVNTLLSYRRATQTADNCLIRE